MRETNTAPYRPEPLPIFFAPLFVDLRPNKLHIVKSDDEAITSAHGRIMLLNSFAVTGHEVSQAIKRSPLSDEEKKGLLTNTSGIFERIVGMVRAERSGAFLHMEGHLAAKALDILGDSEKKENARLRGLKAKQILKLALERVPEELLELAKARHASIAVIPDAGHSHDMVVGEKKGAAFNTNRNILFISESLLKDKRLIGVLKEELRHAADCSLGWFSRKPEFVKAYNAFAAMPENYMLASQRLAEILPKASLSRYEAVWRPTELLVNFFHLKDALEEGQYPPRQQSRTLTKKITFKRPKQVAPDTQQELKRVFGEELYRLCMEFETSVQNKAHSSQIQM